MGELSILRRNREAAMPQFQKLSKMGKQSAAGQTQRTASRAAVTVSETLRQLMGRLSQTDRQVREGRRTLQSGEAALAEVEDSLSRMEKLAQRSAGDDNMDRDALQSELEQIRGEIERMAQNGVKAGLFQDGDGWEGLDALVDAVMDGLSAKQEGVGSLPGWLLSGAAAEPPDAKKLLYALGLDESASGPDLLAALGKLPLEDNPAAGYLATVYLGTVIAGGTPYGTIDPELVAAGLKLFLDEVADGTPPDEALELLTSGAFTSLADFEAQFTGGTAPGLELFLTDFLLSSEDASMGMSLFDLQAGGGSMEEMLMALLDGGGGDGLMTLLDAISADTAEGAALQREGQDAAPQMEAAELDAVQVAGKDLSGASLDPETGAVKVDTAVDLLLRGLGKEAQAIRLAGSGTVTIQQIEAHLLSIDGAQARLLSAGENVLAQVQLGDGTVLTLDGSGLVRIGVLQGGTDSILRLSGGAVALTQMENGRQVSVVLDGPAALLAPDGVAVRSAQGEPLSPFDILWKTMLPEWSALASLEVDGKQGKLALMLDQMDPTRLWLLGKHNDKDRPVHTIVLRGRSRAGRATTQYIYVRWDEKKGGFQEVPMYPNPFTITGGEAEVDWHYDEGTQTLTILTSAVTAISGGSGLDANELPFSGRLVLADGIGAVNLTLNGVTCRVSSGRAFSLGRENDVTLLLQSGTRSVFRSGPGYAGISLGSGTSLRVDKVKGAKGEPDGVLVASGKSGGAGIGRDSGAGKGSAGTIRICGGVVTATGAGGGAGIGGSLGAAVGDIRIEGGTVTAQAACCAAAIGAGIQGACGDITISASAKVANTQGGGPDGDIGGCLFGSCGKVQVSAAADLGGARLWTQEGLSIQVGEKAVTLPKFRMSARTLRLDGLNISTREAARSAIAVLSADRRWVGRLQGAYGAMYGQLGQSYSSMYGTQRYVSAVRDKNEATALTTDIREVLRLSPKAKFLRQRGMEDVGYLLR